MNIGFTVYETLRRLLLLGVGVGVLGFVLAPEQDNGVVELASEERTSTMLESTSPDPVEAVPQKTLI